MKRRRQRTTITKDKKKGPNDKRWSLEVFLFLLHPTARFESQKLNRDLEAFPMPLLLWRRRALEQSSSKTLSPSHVAAGSENGSTWKERQLSVTLRHLPFNTDSDTTAAQVSSNSSTFVVLYSVSFPFEKKKNSNVSRNSSRSRWHFPGGESQDGRALPDRPARLRWSITYGIRDVLFQHYTVVREMGNKNTIQRVP